MRALLNQVKDGFTVLINRPGVISAAGKRAYDAYYQLGEHLVPSRRRARKLDHEFDRRFGVQTKVMWLGSNVASENARFATGYEATKPSWLREAFAALDIRFAEYLFVDIGSGMGRVLLLASDFPFRKIIGIEFSQELHEIAERNIAVYQNESQRCTDLESICIEATQYQIPPGKIVFYFFNPFGPELMSRLLSSIQASVNKHPREVFIIYVNPKFPRVFHQPGFEKVSSGRNWEVYQARAVGRN